MDAAAEIRPGAAGWLDAWRGLEHNPVALHLMRAEQRRRRRTGWLRRNLLVLIGLAGGIVLHSYYFSIAIMPSLGSADQWVHYMVSGLLIVIAPALVLWLAQGVYVAVYDAMGLLGIQGRRQCYLNIDDLASIGLLDDREIVVGAVRVLAPPLLWRVPVFAAALILLKLLIILGFGTAMSGQQVGRTPQAALGALHDIGRAGLTLVEGLRGFWELAPGWLRGLLIALADTPAVLLFGMLACLALMLLMIGLGRGVRIGAVGAAAGSLTALAQIGFVYPGSILHMAAVAMLSIRFSLSSSQAGEATDTLTPAFLIAMPLAAAAFIALAAWSISQSRRGPVARATVAIGLPILAMGGGIVAVAVPDALAFSVPAAWAGVAEPLIVLLSQYDLGWATLAVCNMPIGAVPAGYLWGSGAIDAAHWTDWLRPPTLLLTQLALLALLAGFARESVRRRRHESHS